MVDDEKTLIKFGYKASNLGNFSKRKIIVICDYCGNDYSAIKRNVINQGQEYIKKHSCLKCVPKKQKEVLQYKYGVNYPVEIPGVREKQIQVCLNKYGYKTPLHNPETHNKSKITCLNKYGFNSASSSRRNLVGDISESEFRRIQIGAKKRNLEFSITIEYIWELFIKQNRKCALSGQEIYFGKNRKDERHGNKTASLDRINNKIGYIEGNVQWIHKDINFMKHAYEQEYFIKICEMVCKYMEK